MAPEGHIPSSSFRHCLLQLPGETFGQESACRATYATWADISEYPLGSHDG